MAYGKIIAEGGAGGKLGHSNMSHWSKTAEVKAAARKARRSMAKAAINEQMKDN